MTDIASPSNPRVKALLRLRRRRERDATGRFLIDGVREVGRALAAGVEIDGLYLGPGAGDDADAAALRDAAAARGASITTMATEPFRRVAYGDRERGAVAVARQFPTELAGVDLPPVPLLLVVEAVEKPGNLGTMLRTAAAAGVDAVVVCDPATDVFNPNVIRASLGAVFDVPLAVTGSAAARAWLAARAVPWWASSAAGTAALWAADLTGPAAVVVGSEDSGLGPEWLTDGERVLRIPTADRQESLNAAVAAALLLYEARRQRGTAQPGGAGSASAG